METATSTSVDDTPGAITLCAGDVFAVSDVQPCEGGYVLLIEVCDGS